MGRAPRCSMCLVMGAAMLVTLPAQVFGSGFLLDEQTAAALGRAGAMTAHAPGPAAVWFNPAALVGGPQAGVETTGAILRSRSRFVPAPDGDPVHTRPETHLVPNLFAQARVADRVVVGLGLLAPFGLVVHWPDGWVGASSALRTDVRVLAASGVVAVEVMPRLSLGGGLTVLRGDVALSAGLPPDVGGRADLAGDGHALGATLAALYRFDRLHLGAVYRSRARLNIRGRATFTETSPVFRDVYRDQGARTVLTLPDVASVGVMARPWPWLALLGQIDWVAWSTFDEVRVELDQPNTPDVVSQRGGGNPLTWRLAAEGTLPAGWNWRTGLSLDGRTLPPETLAPSTPDAARAGAGVGIGWGWRHLHVDVGYLYTHFLDATATGGREGPAGTYRTRMHTWALTLGLWRPGR